MQQYWGFHNEWALQFHIHLKELLARVTASIHSLKAVLASKSIC